MDCLQNNSKEDEVRYYLKRENDKYIDFTDDLIKRTGILKDMEFFYLSASDKMIHVPYNRALIQLKGNTKLKIHDKCKNSSISKSLLHYKSISNSKRQLISKRSRPSSHSSDSDAEISESSKHQTTLDTENYEELQNRQQKSSVINVQDENSNSTYLSCDAEKQTNDRINSSGNSSFRRKTNKLNNEHSYKFPVISSDRSQLIKKWFHRNNNCVVTLICNENSKIFQNVLNALNPIVRIENLIHFNNKDNTFTQKDFMCYLGLKVNQNLKKNPLNGKTSTPKVLINSSKRESILKNKVADPFVALKQWTFKKKPLLNHNKVIEKPAIEKVNKNNHSSKVPAKILPISRNYSFDEDICILNWILKNNCAHLLNGNNIWKKFEASNEMITGRTWQSMRNRFLKVILFHLRDYGLSNDNEMIIKKGVQKGCIKHSENYGWVIKKNNKNDLCRERKNKSLLQITYKKMPDTKKPPKDLIDYNHYSDSDVLLDNSVQCDFKKKQSKKKLFTNYSYIRTSLSSQKLVS